MTLPEGMSVTAGAADGLGDCSPGELANETVDSDPGAGCPSSAKIGTVEVDTPLLPDPLSGSIFVAEQDNNPFGTLLAIYLVVKSEERGVIIKLPGRVDPDPESGQLTASFDDNPQLPFSALRLHFKSGPRAPLATPPTCGVKSTEASFSPWSAADPDNPTPEELVNRTDSFQNPQSADGGPCPATLAERPFGLDLSAGVINPSAASSSPFTMKLARPDGHQEISTLQVKTPEGLTAVLKSAGQCGEAEIEANNCPDTAKIGTSTVGAGAGSSPFFVQGGSVYLAGPYDPDGAGPRPRAPLSLDIQVPAIAGPFDLGIVNVRAAVYLDPRTAQLTVQSDPIPQILEGIPLRVRDIRINLDKPGFIVAPSDCEPKSVDALATGINAATSAESSRFQVGDCSSLGFETKLRLGFGGGEQATKRNAHPALKAKLKVPHPAGSFDPNAADAGPSQANLSSVQVTLPKGILLDQDSLSDICTRPEYAAEACPENTQVGYATASSPLLADPLEGPVYLKASDNKLPDLAADLDGIVEIDLFGRIDQSKGRIRNTFDLVPDVAVSRFDLTLNGGDGGLLVNSKTICKSQKLRRARVSMLAQNGASSTKSQLLGAACKSKKDGKKGSK